MSSLPSTISVFTISNGSNIVATDLKFRHLHRGYSMLQVIKFQSCSYNITNIRGGKKLIVPGKLDIHKCMEYALNDFLNKNSSKTKHFSKFLFLTLSMASKLLSNHKIKIFHVGWALSMN